MLLKTFFHVDYFKERPMKTSEELLIHILLWQNNASVAFPSEEQCPSSPLAEAFLYRTV